MRVGPQREPDAGREPFPEWFSDLRREDGLGAPPFEQVWRAAIERGRSAPRTVWYGRASYAAYAAAAILLVTVLVGAVVLLARGPQPQVVRATTTRPTAPSRPRSPAAERPQGGASTTASLAEWRSPTEFLLEQAAEETAPTAPTADDAFWLLNPKDTPK